MSPSRSSRRLLLMYTYPHLRTRALAYKHMFIIINSTYAHQFTIIALIAPTRHSYVTKATAAAATTSENTTFSESTKNFQKQLSNKQSAERRRLLARLSPREGISFEDHVTPYGRTHKSTHERTCPPVPPDDTCVIFRLNYHKRIQKCSSQ